MFRRIQQLKNKLRKFCASTAGTTAVIFGLSLLPILISTGAAIDLSRSLLVRARLSQSLDAAGLAVGGAMELSETELQQLAQDFFNANYPESELGVIGTVNFSIQDGIINLSATATVPTTILALAGIEEVNVGVNNEITRETTGLEVALVMDNTGSMNSNGKIGTLRDSASDLINILFGDDPSPELLHASLVPFVTGVNILADPSFDMSWIDVNAEAAHHGENFNLEGGERVSHLDLFDRIPNATWRGCVEMRAAPYDVLDTPPTAGNPDTLFVPYFWPDEPSNNSRYNNSYMGDRAGRYASYTERQMNTSKYTRSASIDETPSSTRGPNKSCPDPLVPLTNDRDHLLDEVAAMRAWNNSGTNVAHGLSWGWRVLSPGEPFTEGVAYNDEDTQKALILLTDGVNTMCCQSDTHNDSDYTAYGYANMERLGTDNPWAAADVVDDRVVELCENIKAEGIRVYTITFQVSDSNLANIFRNCATSPDLYFDSPSNEDLQQVFRAIGRDLSNLRISA